MQHTKYMNKYGNHKCFFCSDMKFIKIDCMKFIEREMEEYNFWIKFERDGKPYYYKSYIVTAAEAMQQLKNEFKTNGVETNARETESI